MSPPPPRFTPMGGVVYGVYTSLGNKGQRTLPAPLKLASRWRELMSASTPAKTSSLGVSCPTAGLGHALHTLRALSDPSNLRFPNPPHVVPGLGIC